MPRPDPSDRRRGASSLRAPCSPSGYWPGSPPARRPTIARTWSSPTSRGRPIGRGSPRGTPSAPARPGGPCPARWRSTGFLGRGLVNSFHGGDDSTGTLTSPPFRVDRPFLNFLIGGGKYPGETCLDLLVDGTVVRTATGPNDRPGGSRAARLVELGRGRPGRQGGRPPGRRPPEGGLGPHQRRSGRPVGPQEGGRPGLPGIDRPGPLPPPARRRRRPRSGGSGSRSRGRRSTSSTSSWPTARAADFRVVRSTLGSLQLGKTLKIEATLPVESKALDGITQAGEVPDAGGLYREARPAAVPFHVAAGLAERPQRPGLARRRVSPVLPAQPLRLGLGQHALGPRRQPRPRPLDRAADRPVPEGVRRLGVLRERRGRPAEHVGVRPGGVVADGRGLHQHGAGRVHHLQPRPGPDLDRVRGQPGREAPGPRPEAPLARADPPVGHGRLRRGGGQAVDRLPLVARPEVVDV